jgi:DNA-binding HxlR family transcriptional regulator
VLTGTEVDEMIEGQAPALHIAGSTRQERIWADPDDLAMIGRTHEALALVQAKWRVDVLVLLASGVRRHARLVDNLPGLTKKVLSSTLRSLEEDGLISRRVYPELPVRIEYGLSPLGWQLTELLMALYEWSVEHGDELAGARSRRESPDDSTFVALDPSLAA